MSYTVILLITAGIIWALAFCFNTGRGVTEKVVLRRTLSNKNPLLWIFIAGIIYFITKNHLW